MISSTGSSSVSSLPIPTASGNNAPPDGEESTSFNDVMQQQQSPSSPSNANQSSSPQAKPSTPTSNTTTQTSDSTASSTSEPTKVDATTPPVPTSTATAAAPAKVPATPLAAGSDLSAMIIQASVLASNAKQALAAKGLADPATAASSTPSPAATSPAKTTSSSAASGTDLSTLLSQAMALLSGAGKTVTTKTPTATPDKSGKDSDAGTTSSSAKDSTATASSPVDLSTLIAQSSIVVQQASVAAAGAGKDLPVSGLGKALTGVATKEKKSASSSTEGSFLQSGTTTTSASSSMLGLLGALSNLTADSSVNQTLTNASGSKNASSDALASGASTLTGTANVEKGKAMSTDLNFPEIQLLSGSGANATPAQNQADLHIQLASNNDFTDALKQVMHVAQLTQTSESRTPMRVEMEIQTPPGAIVNIYVSKTGDQWRAQLSTNDPVALNWVQNQMSSLRQTSNPGMEIKWLPPQMEAAATTTTSSGQDSNLSWNQGGGQSNYQQPDERQQSGRQKNSDATPELAAIQSNQFMNTLTAAGRAA